MARFDLMGDIVSDGYEMLATDVSPLQFKTFMEATSGDVELCINSGGGDILGGLAICETIRKARAAGRCVKAEILGVAASMAGAIACACDTIEIGPQSYLMIHNPWTSVTGDADEIRHTADVLDSMKKALIALYQSKFDMTEEEISAIMDAETWYTGADLAGMKVKGIVAANTIKAAACITRRSFNNAPEGALAKEAQMEDTEKQVEETPETQETTETVEVQVTLEETPAEVPETPDNTPEKGTVDPEPVQEVKEGALAENTDDGDKEEEPTNEVAKLADCLAKAEAKRRDYQAKADKAQAALKDLQDRFDTFKADASAKMAALAKEKTELETRLARIAASTFGNDTVATVAVKSLADVPPREREAYVKAHRDQFK